MHDRLHAHIVSSTNAHLYARELDQHFRIRSDIFVDEFRWRDLVSVDGRERDQFDTPDAVYVLVTEPGIGVVGGCRLHCSLEPTLLSEIFPDLAAVRGFERAPDIFEWTRLFIVRSRREERPCRVAGAVKAAAYRYCLDEGVRLINCITWTWYVPRFLALGLRPKPLGLPIDRDGSSIMACTVEVSEEGFDTMQAFYGLERMQVVRRGLDKSPAGRPVQPILAA